MKLGDYDEVIGLWKNTPGIGVTSVDDKKSIKLFLGKNKKTCFVALADGEIVGTCLCGDDGRRGFLYHLAVAEKFRKMGIANELVKRCLEGLKKEGIGKCHLFVMKGNEVGMSDYRKNGWEERENLVVFSMGVGKS